MGYTPELMPGVGVGPCRGGLFSGMVMLYRVSFDILTKLSTGYYRIVNNYCKNTKGNVNIIDVIVSKTYIAGTKWPTS